MSGRRFLPVLFSVAAGLMVCAPNMVQAQGGPPGGGGGRDPMAIYQAAGASQDQMAKIRSLADSFNGPQQARAEKIRGLLREMNQLSMQPDPDKATVLAKQNEINNVTAEMANERTKLMLEIRGVLNSEQKQKLVQIMQSAEAQMRQRAAGGGGGGGGFPGGQ